jgi:hypothetical protein
MIERNKSNSGKRFALISRPGMIELLGTTETGKHHGLLHSGQTRQIALQPVERKATVALPQIWSTVGRNNATTGNGLQHGIGAMAS